MSRQSTDEEPAVSPRLRPATSVDVARLAGVSRATVSHVLNNQVERFSAETVARVRDAADALGYVRSAAGRTLVKGRSDFVVLVVPHTTLTNIQDVIETLSAEIERLGLNPVVHFSVPQAMNATSRRLQHLVETLRPAGVIDLGGLSARDVEFLTENGVSSLTEREPPRFNAVIGDLQAAHLHARGYDTLAYAFLSDARDDPYGRMRADAVTAYCARLGLAAPPYMRVPIERDGAQRAVEELLARTGRPVGVACYNDLVAIALVQAAGGLGVAVPGELAAIGVERAPVGQVMSPRLTTVVADVPVSLSHILNALAEDFGGESRRRPTPDEAFSIVQGETT
ncbi:LacI family DNA-binding transcriptional regulator [Actinocorallia populi]|uniref:LacI family DNA-binding transcriptional regulator n=1 Tax=Actinocorallia populi TaxID=2079200 RepID=UPI0018E50B37|nr:LacI family DNA-binding transcriptional regulator [Actinocorallia populi]